MYDIFYYQDINKKEPVREYIDSLKTRSDKESRIKLNKIDAYLLMLQREGRNAGEPYIKHLEGDIWELRPIRDRILFAAWDEDRGFILLHQFMKKTRKTPQKEIDTAKKRLADIRKRIEEE
jgi:phage-related protein